MMTSDQSLAKNLAQNDYIRWFRHVAPYINTHRGKTFVIMFGDEVVNHENFSDLIYDIALLESLGVRLVLVHGARKTIDESLAKYGIETPFANGLRITPKSALPYILNAVGSIRLQIEARFSMGLANSPMYGSSIHVVSGNFVNARPYGVRGGMDYQFTGEVRSIDTTAINQNLANGHIVLLGSMGYSPTGEVFNLFAEEVALQTAIQLKAEKLIFLGEKSVEYGGFIREMTDKQAQDLLANIDKHEPYHPFLQSAIHACQHGVARTHILSYADNGALLGELFTHDGAGTMISKSAYDEIRPATIDDIGGLIKLLEPLEQQGILVPRSRQRLESDIEQFSIIERDGMVIGCGALVPLPADTGDIYQAEIACIAIHPNYRSGSRGADLIAFLQQQAQQQGIFELFALTTRTAHWFMELGFHEVAIERLPTSRLQKYDHERKSKVLLKILANHHEK